MVHAFRALVPARWKSSDQFLNKHLYTQFEMAEDELKFNTKGWEFIQIPNRKYEQKCFLKV